jgi:uncharacterized membrane protein (DUF106 family)
MGMMLLFMILMTVLIMTPSIRTSLGTTADPLLSPLLPEESFFVITVMILGIFSMTLNTVIRNFFVDPMDQAHIGHRQGQVRKMMNEARLSRDPILQEKAMTLQQQMMPEQLEVQMGAMKPMMFTMIFIIGIFAWLTTKVETFRVDYVSLPWAPEWHLLEGRFLFFPAWICCYICMSAAYGRALDRHIKLARYKQHPLVVAGDVLKEPLLHLVATKPASTSSQTKKRQERAKRSQQHRKKPTSSSESDSPSPVSASALACPECDGDVITHDGPRTKRCNICFHEWV